MMRYAIVIEGAENDCSAYAPDLPGCIATGGAIPDVEREDGLPVPEPTRVAAHVDA